MLVPRLPHAPSRLFAVWIDGPHRLVFQRRAPRRITEYHGKRSPTVGLLLKSHWGRISITSTRTVCPGNNFATRVARVTPLLIRRRPALPFVTSIGGIPCVDLPYLAIWYASLTGSAPELL